MNSDFSLFDKHFANFMAKRCALKGEEKKIFSEIIRRLTRAIDSGHTCMDISLGEENLLIKSSLASADTSKTTPFIISNSQLYLKRYFDYEKKLAIKISTLLAKKNTSSDCDQLLSTIFSSDTEEAKEAAKNSVENQFSIICGGPGTGKTTVIVKILALLLSINQQLQIAVTAPTGKAVARLQESINNSLSFLNINEEIKNLIPKTGTTIHRLLGMRKFSTMFRHNENNHLPQDIIIVDEASMVDLPLMSKLTSALKPGAKLILLGDKNQLSSVEAGAILTELTETNSNTIELIKTYRFDHNIQQLAGAIKSGNSKRALEILNSADIHNISALTETNSTHNIINNIGNSFTEYITLAKKSNNSNYHLLFDKLNSLKILSSTRHGKHGTTNINNLIEHDLSQKGLLTHDKNWYIGKPVMITRNDYYSRLFNGDIGICLPDFEDKEKLKIWILDETGTLRNFAPEIIPPHETVYAMTIHKSQGSEFNDVFIILPEKEQKILSRELLYTAITRAKNSITIAASKETIKTAINKKTTRSSGLKKFLNS